jgi:hypothetical protein
MPDTTTVIRRLLRERLRELQAETQRVERALSDLDGKRKGPGRPRGSRTRKKS